MTTTPYFYIDQIRDRLLFLKKLFPNSKNTPIPEDVEKSEVKHDTVNTEKKIEDVVIITSAKINKVIGDIYRLLNYSAISGEYIRNESFSEVLNEIIYQIDTIFDEINTDNLNNPIHETIWDCLINLKQSIRHYLFEFRRYETWIKNPYLRIINDDVSSPDNIGCESNVIIKLASTFFYNLCLVYFDRELIFQDDYLHVVNRLQRKLEELKKDIDEEYLDILIEKSLFLLVKFKYQDDNFLQFANYYDGEVKLVIHDEGDLFYFKDLLKKTHICSTRERNALKNLFLGVDRYSDIYYKFFIRCHYYKKVLKSIVELDILIREFKEFSKNTQDSYTNFCNKVCLNYLYNCRLSLLLKEGTNSITAVWNESVHITNIQDHTLFYNYFPYIKLAQWYCNYIESNITDLSKIDDLKRAVYEMQRCVDKADEHIRHSEILTGSFLPYRPGLNACTEKIKLKDGSTLEVFISTSYMVPVDYIKAKKDISKLTSHHIKYNAIIENECKVKCLIDPIEHSQKKLNQGIVESEERQKKSIYESETKINADLKHNLRSNVQILGIFAGLVLFVSGSVQIYNGATTIRDAATFMLLFASAIGIISTTIWLIVGNKDNASRIKTGFVLIILLFLLVLNLYVIKGQWGGVPVNDTKHKQEVTLDILPF